MKIAPHGEIIENHFRRLSVSGLMLPGRIRRMAEDWRPDAMMSWMPRAARLMPDMPGVTRLTRLGDYPKNLKHFGQSDLLVANTPGIAERCKALGWEKPVKVISNFVRQVDVTPVDRAAIRHAQGRVPCRRLRSLRAAQGLRRDPPRGGPSARRVALDRRHRGAGGRSPPACRGTWA
jgi:hypothetical protein